MNTRIDAPRRPACCGATLVAVGLAVAGSLAMGGSAKAEEGGSGHYLPGSIASFIDAVPGGETFIVRLNGLGYVGSAGVTQRLPFSGKAVVAPKAEIWGGGVTLLWRPPVELGEGWSYAMSATVPYISSDITAKGTAAFANGPSVAAARSGTTTDFGDVVLMPLMVNYQANPDFSVNARLGIYAPTGSYGLGRLSNTGKNFWTIEPTLGLIYFGQKNGIEASLYFGPDFNTENNATHYRSGTQFHADATLAQHFPWLGGISGVGVSAYAYQQVTADSGSGAGFGAFEGQSIGLGPVVSYIGKIGTHDAILELKWLHEVQTHNRLQGDIFWLKAVTKF
jgi:hypothetical protein